jgi:copper chaperone CopZ
MKFIWRRLLEAPKAHVEAREGDVTTLRLEGIVCDQVCAVRTKRALAGLPGVRSVRVDHATSTATVEGGSHDAAVYTKAIEREVAGMGARRIIERVALAAGRGRAAAAQRPHSGRQPR